MFSKASDKCGVSNTLGSVVFKERIAPRIADHIQRPISVCVSGEDARLTAWLVENLSTIKPLRIRLLDACLQKPASNHQKKD